MRFSQLIGRTLRQPPADAHLISHQLLVRAGYVLSLEGGLFAYLPLGRLAQRRLWAAARRELEAAGGQEIALPALAGAAVAADVARREVDSYRQLPAVLFQAQTQPSFPGSARAGLFGAGQRQVVDVYAAGGAHPVPAPYALAAAEREIEAAIDRLLAVCGVPATWAEAGDGGRRLYVAHESGDEALARCPGCGYAAERSRAATPWPPPAPAPDLPIEEIETPNCNTIAALAAFLDVPAAQTLKMVFVTAGGRVVCLVIRGDRQIDEDKLARLLGTRQYAPSSEAELVAVGAVGGYASPIGLDRERVRVVADGSLRAGRNWITGANRPGYHLRHANVPRDFEPGEWADLALIEPGDPCPRCGSPLAEAQAFSLAESRPAAPAGGEFLDEAGTPQPIRLAHRQLDLGRLLPAIVERHHDEYGLAWPAACAPLDVHVVALDLKQPEVVARAEALVAGLEAAGLAVLYDDREASAGVKFADADLIGLPLRLTIGKRAVSEGTIEAKWRGSPDRLKLDEAGLAAELARLRGESE